MGNTINKRLKEIKTNIESAFATVTNNTFINEIKNQINTLTTNTTNSNANITKMIVEASFSNLPPKIGYLDETTVPINANFNMSYNEVSGLAWWAIGDLEGRENLYFRGSPSGGQGRAIYRCSRSSLSAGGYFSILPSQELALYPNSTNYVWLERSQENYTKIIVTVNKTAPTSSNYDGFSKIPIAAIGTDSEGPVSTTYYHYENYKNRAV